VECALEHSLKNVHHPWVFPTLYIVFGFVEIVFSSQKKLDNLDQAGLYRGNALDLIWEVLASSLGWDMTEVSFGFPWSLQANAHTSTLIRPSLHSSEF
jgi:hypothetical protein